jgi:hypothetical protein
MAIEHLPAWLCEELIPFVQRRQKRAKHVDLPISPERQTQIRKLIKKTLSQANVFSEKDQRDLPPWQLGIA